MKKSKITSHILDTELGRPASMVKIILEVKDNGKWKKVSEGVTDDDGRVVDWISDSTEISIGEYRVNFGVKDYFQRQNRKCFYPSVSIEFNLDNLNEHYHVPLLLNAHGYSTYRGS